jgi:hypothetical protein
MPRQPITTTMIIGSIETWREQVQEIFNTTDPDQIRRLLLHLDLAMEQVIRALHQLCPPDEPLP